MFRHYPESVAAFIESQLDLPWSDIIETKSGRELYSLVSQLVKHANCPRGIIRNLLRKCFNKLCDQETGTFDARFAQHLDFFVYPLAQYPELIEEFMKRSPLHLAAVKRFYLNAFYCSRNLKHLPEESIFSLCSVLHGACVQEGDIAGFVRPLRSSALKTRVLNAVLALNATPATLLGEALLRCMPRKLRFAHVERMLSLDAVKACREKRAKILCFGPIEDHIEELKANCHSTAVEDRCAAVKRLIECAGLCRTGLGSVLRFLQSFKNDQAQVVESIFFALCTHVPVSLFTVENVSQQIASLLSSVIEKGETTYFARSNMCCLLESILRAHPMESPCSEAALEVAVRTELLRRKCCGRPVDFSKNATPSQRTEQLFIRLLDKYHTKDSAFTVKAVLWFGT